MALHNMSIRKAVIYNIHDMDSEQLREMVTDSIEQKEEKLLPGLGVVFETIWENSDAALKEPMIQTLQTGLPDHAEKPL